MDNSDGSKYRDERNVLRIHDSISRTSVGIGTTSTSPSIRSFVAMIRIRSPPPSVDDDDVVVVVPPMTPPS
jgi:hypothetical protein